MNITGSQFIASNTQKSYTVTGIPSGYALSSTVLPSGWSIVSTGTISGGSQTFSLKSSNNSGTFIANYSGSGSTASSSLDISVNATTMGESIQSAVQLTTSPKSTLGDNISVNTKAVNNNTIPLLYVRPTNPGNVNCPTPLQNCPFSLNVYADVYDTTNPLNNDQSDFYYQGNALVSDITMTLQKSNGCGGIWSNVLTLSNSYVKQAFLAITISSWAGNYYMLGTFYVGAITYAVDYYGTYSGYLTYLASIINADGTYSATVQAAGITVSGKNGSLSNGKVVKQTLINTSNAFSATQIQSDERILNATGTTVNLTYNPVRFSNIEINTGSVFNGTTYTAGSDPIQTFAGILWFESRATIDANFDGGVFLIYLKKNGITIAILSLNSATFNGNGIPTEFGFEFPNISVAPGDQITLAAYCNLSMYTSGNGTSLIGNIGGSWWNTSSATATTNWGSLSGGVTGVGTFAKVFSYGTAPDFSGNSFTDDYGNQYTGALLSWLPILQGYGPGEYQMQVVYTMTDGSTQTIIDNRQFCLSQYNCNVIDGSVRLEVWNIGIRGTLFNSNTYIDYGSAGLVLSNNKQMSTAYKGWYSQVRLGGIFFNTKYQFTKEYNQYGDDDMNAYKPITIESAPKYTLQVRPIPGYLDWFLVINVAEADTILITDYNAVNRHNGYMTQVPVIIDGDIAPKDEVYMNPLAVVEVPFTYGQNNLRRRND